MKKGDKVRCVSREFGFLTDGKIYEIVSGVGDLSLRGIHSGYKVAEGHFEIIDDEQGVLNVSLNDTSKETSFALWQFPVEEEDRYYSGEGLILELVSELDKDYLEEQKRLVEHWRDRADSLSEALLVAHQERDAMAKELLSLQLQLAKEGIILTTANPRGIERYLSKFRVKGAATVSTAIEGICRNYCNPEISELIYSDVMDLCSELEKAGLIEKDPMQELVELSEELGLYDETKRID